MEIVMSQQKIKNPKYYLHSCKLQRGTTIIEGVVAIFVLSFGVLALMLAQITAVNTSINAANQGEITRAVQNLVEEMRSHPKIILQEKEDANGNKIQFFNKNYSNYATDEMTVCSNRINVHLVNAKLIECTIGEDGTVKVTWGGQALNNNETPDNFSYSLTAGQS